MTNWCENLVTISNDDRRVIKEIETPLSATNSRMRSFLAQRRRNNHASRSPITGRYSCGNRESPS
jgi:hypothetical protein